MAYFSQTDIEQFTGFGSGDFKQSGVTMTATQWATFATFVIGAVTQIVNRFCNVPSFEQHTSIEYKNGRGPSGDGQTYLDSDRTYTLRECATSVASIAEDINYGSSYPSWTDRVEQDTDTYGDYIYWTDQTITRIRFHQNVPNKGVRNVRVTYTAGYPVGSPELDDIKQMCLRCARNLLILKKKTQEAQTIRYTGTKDYAQMFELEDERKVLTDDIRIDLCRYRRWNFGGDLWY